MAESNVKQMRNARRRSGLAAALAGVALAGACTSLSPLDRPDAAKLQVIATERAFAATMARRDLAAFSSFVSDEAVFFSGPAPLRGRAQVTAWWARYFKDPVAPFSWEPEEVEVLDSGALAISSGPVRDPNGKVFARFTSIWRQEAGTWRIIFDKGTPVAPSAPNPQ